MRELIEEIRLEGMLPKVFASEDIPFSEVWKSSLTFRKGEFYRIEAASGAGKSSLCSFIYGARKDYEGLLFFNKEKVSDLSIESWQEIRRRHLAYLPQELMLFPELTALENIHLKNDLTKHFSQDKIEDMMKRLGIDSRRNYPAGKMSVGQQQRVAIIRALCQPFDFILLDEPVSHLDENNNRIAAEMITEEAQRQGAGIISTSVGNPLLLNKFISIRL